MAESAVQGQYISVIRRVNKYERLTVKMAEKSAWGWGVGGRRQRRGLACISRAICERQVKLQILPYLTMPCHHILLNLVISPLISANLISRNQVY